MLTRLLCRDLKKKECLCWKIHLQCLKKLLWLNGGLTCNITACVGRPSRLVLAMIALRLCVPMGASFLIAHAASLTGGFHGHVANVDSDKNHPEHTIMRLHFPRFWLIVTPRSHHTNGLVVIGPIDSTKSIKVTSSHRGSIFLVSKSLCGCGCWFSRPEFRFVY